MVSPFEAGSCNQLVKLAVAEQLSADLLVYADSDVVLLRPFSVSSLVDADGRVRLYAREDYIDAGLPDHVRWHRSAEKLLGSNQPACRCPTSSPASFLEA